MLREARNHRRYRQSAEEPDSASTYLQQRCGVFQEFSLGREAGNSTALGDLQRFQPREFHGHKRSDDIRRGWKSNEHYIRYPTSNSCAARDAGIDQVHVLTRMIL